MDDTARDVGALPGFRESLRSKDSEAQCSLGLCYFAGIGVRQDPEAAVGWFKKAADQGHAEAQCNLLYS